MRRWPIFFIALGLFVLPTQVSAANPKPGDICRKSGQTATYKGVKFTCIKSGKKLIWNKGVVIKPIVKPTSSPAPEPSPASKPQPIVPQTPVPGPAPVVKIDYSKTFSTDNDYFVDFVGGPCEADRNLTGQLAEVQKYFLDLNNCAGQLRVNKYSLGIKRPTTNYAPASNFSTVQSCKLVAPQNVMSNLGFTTAEEGRNRWANSRRYPSPNTVIQLIPVYADDTAAPKNSPEDDYKVFLDFFKNWIEYSSDFGSNVKIQIPDKYIKMNTKLSSYGIFHENNHDNPSHVRFNKDVVSAVDSLIDFTGVNIGIVVPPAGTKASVLGQGALNSMQTTEGVVNFAFSQYAAFAESPKDSKFTNLSHPFWWIHESFHAGYGFDDHYGDTLRNVNSEYGMGWLTLMTPFGGDLTTWEKWILGFMRDTQIQCLTNPSVTMHWIAPSTVQTQESKSVIIPISSTKVVVVESRRPGGLDYKAPKSSQGVMVYEIDLMKTAHGMGMKLALPVGRIPGNGPFFMADYPLKHGEFTITNGYRIEVMESGTFGDVIQISKTR